MYNFIVSHWKLLNKCWHLHILSVLLLSAPLSRHVLRAANVMGCLRVRHACILNKTDNKSCHVHLGLSNCLPLVMGSQAAQRRWELRWVRPSCMAVVLTFSSSSCQQKAWEEGFGNGFYSRDAMHLRRNVVLFLHIQCSGQNSCKYLTGLSPGKVLEEPTTHDKIK